MPCLTVFVSKKWKRSSIYDYPQGRKGGYILPFALIGNPDVIFLDEPTAGLDVEGRLALHEQIRNLKSHGKTIVLASHDMAEVETLCDRIAILNNGNIVFCGTASELTDKVGRKYFYPCQDAGRRQHLRNGQYRRHFNFLAGRIKTEKNPCVGY